MIASLQGKISEKHLGSIVIDVNGVGYEVLVPLSALSLLDLNEDAKLQIYEHIRDNIYDLYGFMDNQTKNLFMKLINVSGVGPKAGLSILNIGSTEIVKNAIASGNLKLIQSAQGIGKKVAERVIIDLKDKVGLISSVDEKSLLTSEEMAIQDEAVQALVALGYSINDALTAVDKIDKNLEVKERVRLALKSK